MNANTSVEQTQPTTGIDRGTVVKAIVRAVIFLFLLPTMLFASAGTLDWLWGWVYVVVAIGSTVVSRLLMARKYPDLVAERARWLEAEGAKSWDKVIVPLVALILPLVVLMVAGLDVRFGWSPALGLPVRLVALAVIVLAHLIGAWALLANKFFSGTVRIQTDRGHTVVSDGPYRFVRHPGYISALLSYLAVPLLLGSSWALVPGAVLAVLFVVRTALEDRTLQAELPGYADYAARTRYRLVPGIW